MARAHDLRVKFFHKGAVAIQRDIGRANCYVCPLCLRVLTEDAIHSGQLTIEHVPPKALKGRGILLTCMECNNSSGITLDSALQKRDEQWRFSQTVLGEDTSYKGWAKWQVDGKSLNVVINHDGKMLTIAGVPGRNNPEVTAFFTKSPSATGRLTSSVRYRRRRADVGDLRTAYLATFALLGYRYALQPALNPIREQIANPDLEVLDRWSIPLDLETPAARRIFEVREPHCLLVQFDRVAVLLPIPGSSDRLYQQLEELSGLDGRVRLNGDYLLGWPTTLELREDFNAESHLPPLALSVDENWTG